MRKYAGFLKQLHKASPSLRNAMLKSQSENPEFIRCMSNCCLSIIKGTVPITSSQFQQLRKQKKNLRLISEKKTPVKKKKAIIQSGGFLSTILPIAISALGSLFGGLLSKRT